jgi:hypothetical protein
MAIGKAGGANYLYAADNTGLVLVFEIRTSKMSLSQPLLENLRIPTRCRDSIRSTFKKSTATST